MPGTKGHGRNKTPTAKLRLAGGYREDRHGKRKAEPQPRGTPCKPTGMSPQASKHWEEVVPQLVAMGVAKRVDKASLTAMCEAFSRLQDMHRYYRKACVQDRIDILPRINQSQDAWVKLAARFGLTPSDRAGMQVEATPGKSDFEEMLA